MKLSTTNPGSLFLSRAGALAMALALAAPGCGGSSRQVPDGTGGGSAVGGAGAGPGGGGAGGGQSGGGAAGAPPCAEPPVVVGDFALGWAAALGEGELGGLAVDPAGNAVITGAYLDGLTVGGQPLSSTGSGYHPFVAVLDPGGARVWARTMSGNWQPSRPGVDAAGNIYLAGASFAGSVDLGNGPLSGSLIVAKLDPQGNALWSHSFEAFRSADLTLAASSDAIAVAVDAAGDLAVMGTAVGPVDFGGGLPPASDEYQGFLVVFDTNGGYRFSKTFSSNGRPPAVAFDETGRLLFGGDLEGARDLGGGVTLTATTDTGFVALLDPTGAALSASTFGQGSATSAVAIGGGVDFVAGNFEQQFTAGGHVASAVGLDDLFLVADDETPAMTTVTTAISDGDFIGALALAGDGGAVALAQLGHAVDLGTGLIDRPGLALLRMDRVGHTLASAAFDAPYGATAGSVAVDQGGGIFAYGTFQGAIDLGAGPLTAPDTATSILFVGRFTQSPAPARHAVACPPPAVAGALLSGPNPASEPTAMLVQGDTLYYTTGTEVMSMPAAGGAPAVLAFGQRNVTAFATDGQRLFWATNGHDHSEGLPPDGQIVSIPLAGGTPTVLASGQSWPAALAVNDVDVYWTSGSPLTYGGPSRPADGAISALPLGGGLVTVLAAGLDTPGSVAAAGGCVAFATTLPPSGEQIPTPAPASSQIFAIPRTGGTPLMLAATSRNVASIATDGTTVFWIDASQTGTDFTIDNGGVNAVPASGGAVTTLATGLPAPKQLALVGDQVYWADGGGFVNVTSRNTGDVRRMTKAGAPLPTIVSGLVRLQTFAADQSHVVYVQTVDPYSASWAMFGVTP